MKRAGVGSVHTYNVHNNSLQGTYMYDVHTCVVLVHTTYMGTTSVLKALRIGRY